MHKRWNFKRGYPTKFKVKSTILNKLISKKNFFAGILKCMVRSKKSELKTTFEYISRFKDSYLSSYLVLALV